MSFRSVLSRTGCFGFAALLLSASASACTLCHTTSGKQVRAGIFNSSFCVKLLATAAPFPVFIAVVGLIYFGPPNSSKH